MAQTKTVVELDLVGYSDVARVLEDNLGAKLVTEFNAQIQSFVETGLKASKARGAILATTGDGAIVAFDQATDAVRFGTELHRATQRHNATRTAASAQRWFRVGIATGELDESNGTDGKAAIAGTVIADAVRLETAARPGQIVVDHKTYDALDAETKVLAGDEEKIPGKREEVYRGRRITVVPYAIDAQSSTIATVLELLEQLREPAAQLDRLFITLQMPRDFRPDRSLSVFERKTKFLDWVDGGGGLAAAERALRYLISQQGPRR